jgi:hypothetical protein
MKNTLLFSLSIFLLSHLCIHAQEIKVKWGKEFKKEKYPEYTKGVLKLDDRNVYLLRTLGSSRNTTFDVQFEVIDTNANVTYVPYAGEKKELQMLFQMNNKSYVVLGRPKNNQDLELLVQEISEDDLKPVGEEIKLHTVKHSTFGGNPITGYKDENVYRHIYISDDNLALAVLESSKDKKEVIISVYDTNFNLSWRKEKKFKEPKPKNFYWLRENIYFIDQNTFILGSSKERQRKVAKNDLWYKYYLNFFRKDYDKPKQIELTEGIYFITKNSIKKINDKIIIMSTGINEDRGGEGEGGLFFVPYSNTVYLKMLDYWSLEILKENSFNYFEDYMSSVDLSYFTKSEKKYYDKYKNTWYNNAIQYNAHLEYIIKDNKMYFTILMNRIGSKTVTDATFYREKVYGIFEFDEELNIVSKTYWNNELGKLNFNQRNNIRTYLSYFFKEGKLYFIYTSSTEAEQKNGKDLINYLKLAYKDENGKMKIKKLKKISKKGKVQFSKQSNFKNGYRLIELAEMDYKAGKRYKYGVLKIRE